MTTSPPQPEPPSNTTTSTPKPPPNTKPPSKPPILAPVRPHQKLLKSTHKLVQSNKKLHIRPSISAPLLKKAHTNIPRISTTGLNQKISDMLPTVHSINIPDFLSHFIRCYGVTQQQEPIEHIQPDLIVIDIRDSDFKGGHVPHSLHLPHSTFLLQVFDYVQKYAFTTKTVVFIGSTYRNNSEAKFCATSFAQAIQQTLTADLYSLNPLPPEMSVSTTLSHLTNVENKINASKREKAKKIAKSRKGKLKKKRQIFIETPGTSTPPHVPNSSLHFSTIEEITPHISPSIPPLLVPPPAMTETIQNPEFYRYRSSRLVSTISLVGPHALKYHFYPGTNYIKDPIHLRPTLFVEIHPGNTRDVNPDTIHIKHDIPSLLTSLPLQNSRDFTSLTYSKMQQNMKQITSNSCCDIYYLATGIEGWIEYAVNYEENQSVLLKDFDPSVWDRNQLKNYTLPYSYEQVMY